MALTNRLCTRLAVSPGDCVALTGRKITHDLSAELYVIAFEMCFISDVLQKT